MTATTLGKLAGSGKQDQKSMIAMQYDQTSPFVAKLQAMFNALPAPNAAGSLTLQTQSMENFVTRIRARLI